MSQHGCGERLSNRSKVFQEDGSAEPTMEVLVETLTGTAFEMTVSPSDTIFAIKSKIFRVEGIPVSQQHLVYNLRELEDVSSLRAQGVCAGARLRLVLGMRGGPIATRRLPPHHPHHAPLDGPEPAGRVTLLVFRDGERVNMLRVRENTDGTYSPIEHDKYSPCPSSSASVCEEAGGSAGGAGVAGAEGATTATLDNATTMHKMAELRRRMDALHIHRHGKGDKAEMQKTRSEETLSVASLTEEAPLYEGGYARYEYECAFPERYTLLPPIGARGDTPPASDEELAPRRDHPARPRRPDGLAPIPAPDYGGGAHSQSASSLALRPAPAHAHRHPPPLFSSSTSELDHIKRNSGRLLPALSRHRPVSQLHLSDPALHAPAPPGATAGAAPGAPARARCVVCLRRLGACTVHVCACGATCCAPHRYPEAHGCSPRPRTLPRL